MSKSCEQTLITKEHIATHAHLILLFKPALYSSTLVINSGVTTSEPIRAWALVKSHGALITVRRPFYMHGPVAYNLHYHS